MISAAANRRRRVRVQHNDWSIVPSEKNMSIVLRGNLVAVWLQLGESPFRTYGPAFGWEWNSIHQGAWHWLNRQTVVFSDAAYFLLLPLPSGLKTFLRHNGFLTSAAIPESRYAILSQLIAVWAEKWRQFPLPCVFGKNVARRSTSGRRPFRAPSAAAQTASPSGKQGEDNSKSGNPRFPRGFQLGSHALWWNRVVPSAGEGGGKRRQPASIVPF